MNRKLLIIGVILIGLLALYNISQTTDAGVAERIVASCSRADKPMHCYESTVPTLFPSFTIPEIFDVIRQIRTLDPNYQFCHVLAHRLGELAVAEDPNAWLTKLAHGPYDGMCSNGYMHGVIVGRFDNSTLTDAEIETSVDDFTRACAPRDDWSPTPLDRGICYHGLGHLYMFITNARLEKALGMCRRTARTDVDDFTKVCIEGVFMQVFQPLDPEDFELVAQLDSIPTRETYRTWCGTYKNPMEQGACLREAWPLFGSEVLAGTAVPILCADQPNEEETSNCVGTVATIVGRQLLGQTGKIKTACDAFPKEARVVCFRAAAQAIIEEDRARGAQGVALCMAAGPDSDACLSDLATRAHFIFASRKERADFCAHFPDHYTTVCMRNP